MAEVLKRFNALEELHRGSHKRNISQYGVSSSCFRGVYAVGSGLSVAAGCVFLHLYQSFVCDNTSLSKAFTVQDVRVRTRVIAHAVLLEKVVVNINSSSFPCTQSRQWVSTCLPITVSLSRRGVHRVSSYIIRRLTCTNPSL